MVNLPVAMKLEGKLSSKIQINGTTVKEHSEVNATLEDELLISKNIILNASFEYAVIEGSVSRSNTQTSFPL
jgi:hypothetical protein